MSKWLCSRCGYIYYEESGDLDHGIPANTPFANLPSTWVCPRCKAEKSFFKEIG